MPSNIDDPKACKAFNENEVPALRFSALMKNPDMRGKLQEYAKKEHSEENLLFYNDALAFRKRFTTFGKGDLSQSDKVCAAPRLQSSATAGSLLTALNPHLAWNRRVCVPRRSE